MMEAIRQPVRTCVLVLMTAAVIAQAAVAGPRRDRDAPQAPRPARPRPAAPAPAPTPTFFTTPLTADAMRGKQAVLQTDAGEIVIDLLSAAAPNHVGHFIKNVTEHAYDGVTFHRVIKHGIIQGGDPLTKDPSKRDLYGTGGLGTLRAELNAERHTRGAVSAVLRPNQPDSGGSQFFICVSDQPAIDGQYTVFGRVSEGLDIVTKISEAAVDAQGKTVERIAIRSAVIRDAPPPTPPPFSTESVADLAAWRAVVETTRGAFTIEFTPDKAPEHVRNFLRLASVGAYDGTAFHRVVPGFVVQTGMMSTRTQPLTEKQQRFVPASMAPEFNDAKHVKGVVSMARLEDPASASTSFFVCTAPAPSLDSKYTAFGRVIDGMSVIEAIEAAPRNGESPEPRVDLIRVRLEKAGR